jgi:predicted nucleic acid-binding protein
LTDDRAARKQAQAWEVIFSGTLGILVLAIQKGHVNIDEGNLLLRTMINHANYRSPVTDLQDLLS